MTYQQISPDSALKDYIRCYWWLDNNTNENLEYTILPDGCFDVILYFENKQLKRIVLTGLFDKAIDVTIAPNSQLIGIQFKLLAVDYLVGSPIANRFNQQKEIPSNYWKLDTVRFDNIPQAIHYFNTHFLSLLESQKKIDSRKQQLFHLINQTKGNEQVAYYAEKVHWTSRQINRYFQKRFGLSLKAYCTILKCAASFKDLKIGTLTPTHNYFDQSHFVKSLKKHTGNSPKVLYKNKNDRFLQLSIIPNP